MEQEKSEVDLPEDEAARRRDEVVKRMLATPPQPRTAKPAKSSPKREDENFHRVRAGLEEAVRHAQGEDTGAVIHRPKAPKKA